jgi:hypothetical protein
VHNVHEELITPAVQKWVSQILENAEKMWYKMSVIIQPVALQAATEPDGAPPINTSLTFFLGQIIIGRT